MPTCYVMKAEFSAHYIQRHFSMIATNVVFTPAFDFSDRCSLPIMSCAWRLQTGKQKGGRSGRQQQPASGQSLEISFRGGQDQGGGSSAAPERLEKYNIVHDLLCNSQDSPGARVSHMPSCFFLFCPKQVCCWQCLQSLRFMCRALHSSAFQT